MNYSFPCFMETKWIINTLNGERQTLPGFCLSSYFIKVGEGKWEEDIEVVCTHFFLFKFLICYLEASKTVLLLNVKYGPLDALLSVSMISWDGPSALFLLGNWNHMPN